MVYIITNTILHVAAGSSKKGLVQAAEFEEALEVIWYSIKWNLKSALILDCSMLVNVLNGDSSDTDTANLPFVDRLRLVCS